MIGVAAAAVALLVGAQPQTSPQECRAPIDGGVVDILATPLPVKRVDAGVPVRAAPNAVLAEERMQVATRIWRTREPMRLAGERFTWAAGIRVTALLGPRGPERCLRDALAPTDRRAPRERVLCLIDEDGDGLFEAADIVPRNAIMPFVGTRPRFRPLRRARLETPVALEEDPRGLDSSRMFVHRRLRIVGTAGDRVEVVAEQAVQNAPGLISYSVGGGAPEPVAAGPVEYRRVGAARTVALADGEEVAIGGIRFRADRSPAGWSLIPLDSSFPDWLSVDCAGTRLSSLPVAL